MKKAKIILIAASAAMLLTGCMRPEETEALSAWTMERCMVQTMAVQQSVSWQSGRDKMEIEEAARPFFALASGMKQADATPQEVEPKKVRPGESEPNEPQTGIEAPSSSAASGPSPQPAMEAKAEAEEQPSLSSVKWRCPPITYPSDPKPVQIPEWPYPAITCPPEPSPTPQPETPDIPAAAEPSPAPTSTVAPAEPSPVPEPMPVPVPVETPPAIPEPMPTPTGGYALCSCGATLTPDALVPHMKAHAMNGESHSYIAY